MDKLLLSRLRFKIDSTVNYLTPLLPMANCHMVEYIKENNWEKFIPKDILNEVGKHEIEAAIESFWYIKNNMGFTSHKNIFNPPSEEIESSKHIEKFPHLLNYIENANVNALTESDFCMTFEQFTNKLKTRGANSTSQPIKIPEFMSNKKSHEVSFSYDSKVQFKYSLIFSFDIRSQCYQVFSKLYMIGRNQPTLLIWVEEKVTFLLWSQWLIISLFSI